MNDLCLPNPPYEEYYDRHLRLQGKRGGHRLESLSRLVLAGVTGQNNALKVGGK